MAGIELFLLGPPRLERDGVPRRFDTRKILTPVAYLAVSRLGAEGACLSRDSLLALLWPELEPSRARAVLRRVLWLLRSALQGEWLVIDSQMVSTDAKADFWLGVDQFTRLVRAREAHGHSQEQVCPECLEALTEAVDLYQGAFLEGFGLRDSVAYDDWQFFQAEGLRQAPASALAMFHEARIKRYYCPDLLGRNTAGVWGSPGLRGASLYLRRVRMKSSPPFRRPLLPLGRCGRMRTRARRSDLWDWPPERWVSHSWRDGAPWKRWRLGLIWGPICR